MLMYMQPRSIYRSIESRFRRCTRLEIGVQSIYEDVARDTNRGHTIRAVCESFEQAKDAGFKVVAHMMPNLPNVDLDRDIFQFKVIIRLYRDF